MSNKEEEIRVEVTLSEPQMDVATARTNIIAGISGQGGGKTVVLGLLVGQFVTEFPEAKGFIGANTYEQLSSSTLSRVFAELENIYGLTEYNQYNPYGHYVVGKMPPANAGWVKPKYKFKKYNNIMSFWNGAVVFLGSLDNYKTHDGKEFAWAHLDETKDTKKEALTAVILGRLRQYGLWVDKHDAISWEPDISPELALAKGLRAWNPLYIHTSPAEGNVDWLIDLLGIAPYDKEILNAITKPEDYFFKVIRQVDGLSKLETATTVVIYSSYHNKANLPPGFIEGRKAKLSNSEQLKFISGYPFGRNGGEFYPGFSRFNQVMPLKFNPALATQTTWDFNAVPYVTCEVAQVEYIKRWWDEAGKRKYTDWREGLVAMEVLQIRFVKEYTMLPPVNTTEQTADSFYEDFKEHNPEVFVYGDASGRSRIEGLGSLTQYKIIEKQWQDKLYLSEGWLKVKKINIARLKRRDLMNRIWEGRIPEVEVLIDPSCENLIRDCEYLLQGKDGGKHKEMEKDKNGIEFQKLGHTSDAMEYLVCELCQDFLKLS